MIQAKKNFCIFYVFRTIAFIVPILFIYLETEKGIGVPEILLISGIYTMLPFFLEIPLGILADKIGKKKILNIGLICQIMACISLLVLKGSISYNCYILFIFTANCAFSGADVALARELFMESEDEAFTQYLSKLDKNFYLYTAGLILMGACLYQWNKSLPFLLQIGMFCVALIALNRIPEKKKNSSREGSLLKVMHSNKKDLRKIFLFIFKNNEYLALMLISMIFGMAVNINFRTIQSQIHDVLSTNSIIATGAVIAVGNLISSLGATLYSKTQNFFRSWALRVTVALIFLLLALGMMSIKSAVSLFSGYLLICLFKTYYRIISGSELTNRIPFTDLRATTLSIVSLIGAIVGTGIQVGFSQSYENVFHGNLVYMIFSLGSVAFLIFIGTRKINWSIFLSFNDLTRKHNFLARRDGHVCFEQFYPEEISTDHIECVKKNINSGIYPAAKATVAKVKNRAYLRTKYLSGETLGNIKEKEVKKGYILTILNESVKTKPHGVGEEESYACGIFDGEALQFMKMIEAEDGPRIIHGDLHPENIIIFDDQPFVVDWDLSGVGYRWFDVLTLITHPHSGLKKDEQSDLFREFISDKDDAPIEEIFTQFLRYKYESLAEIAESLHDYKSIAEAYYDQLKQNGI